MHVTVRQHWHIVGNHDSSKDVTVRDCKAELDLSRANIVAERPKSPFKICCSKITEDSLEEF
jgi:hypothetical protein